MDWHNPDVAMRKKDAAMIGWFMWLILIFGDNCCKKAITLTDPMMSVMASEVEGWRDGLGAA